MDEIRNEEMMNANTESNRLAGVSGRKSYQIAFFAFMLLAGGAPAAMADAANESWAEIGLAQTLNLRDVYLAEAKTSTVKIASSSDSNKDTDDADKQDKKQKKKLEKQAEKDAEEAAKAKKIDNKAAEKAAKKDEKASDKDAEKNKKDLKGSDTVKGKTVIIEQSPAGDKATSVTTHKEITDTTSDGAAKTKAITTEDKKTEEDNKTADTEVKPEIAPIYTPDSALISVLKDLSRSLKESEEFTKIEDPSQKEIIELAHRALQKALDNPQLTANRIVEKVGKESLMPPMGTEAWSSGEIDLGGRNKASLSAVWAKRENGLLNLTIAGICPDKKASNGKKIGEFIVLMNARSSVETGFDIQSQQNVSFWLGKIASIAVESDCCASPAATAAGPESSSAKPPQEIDTSDDVKKKSLIPLPQLLTNRRSEYLATLLAVEKHNARIIEKLQETNLANVRKDNDNKHDALSIAQLDNVPAGAEGKAMQEAYERALHAVAMKEFMKMQTEKTAEGSKPDAEPDDKLQDKASSVHRETDKLPGSPSVTAALGTIQATATNTMIGDKGETKPVISEVSKTPAALAITSIGAVGSPVQTGIPAAAAPITVQTMPAATTPVNPTPVNPTVTQTVQSALPAQISSIATPQTQSNPITNSQQTLAVLPTGTNAIAFNGNDSVAAFRSIRQPSIGALMMVPERALAGQGVTITVYDAKRNPESSVELSLNGSTMLTNLDGQVSFTIPEDATPGRSLNVALSARPESSPNVIDILQPLTVPSEKQNPSIEKVVLTGPQNDTLIVEGHFFDGIAANNKIIIDGQPQGRIAAASPVELRVSLPYNLQGGDHIVLISCGGLNSNPSIFATQAAPTPAVMPSDKKHNKPTTSKYRY